MRRGRGQRNNRCLTWLWLAAALLAGCSRTPSESEDELYRRAVLSLQQGDLNHAETLIQRGSTEWQDRSDSAWHWRYRILQAELLMAQGMAADALELVDLDLPQRPELADLTARWNVVRAYTLTRTSRRSEARGLLDEAEAWANANGQQDLLPKIKVHRGHLLTTLNRPEDAEREFYAALERAEQSNDYYYEAAALNNLGLRQINSARYDAAIPLLERALASARKMGAKLTESAALTNIGLCARRLGDFDKALSSFEDAVATQESQGAHLYLQASLGELGNTHVFQKQPREAIPYYRRALDLAKEIGAASEAAKWSGNLAVALIELQDWDQAEKLNQESIALKEQLNAAASLRYSRLISADIAAGRGEDETARQLYENVIQDSAGTPEFLWEAHARLGKLLRREGNNEKASQHFETAIQMIESARDELTDGDFRITLLARLIGFYQEYVDALIDQQAYDKALRVVESSRARVLSERMGKSTLGDRTAAAADYRLAAARSETVFLSYWLAPKRSFLWAITPQGLQVFVLPPQQEIETLVASHETFIQNLRDPLEAEPIAGDRLYEMLLAPARDAIFSEPKVVIVPDGSLHNLNFETLPVGGSARHYWIEDVTVAIAPSLASQLERTAVSPRTSLLVIGDAESAGAEFEKLPYAGKEIASIEHRLAALNQTVYQGAEARPAVYRSAEPRNFSIIHFAAHALANRESPLDSAIILSKDGESFKLYARDLIDLPLSADLVTISGCRSAGARVYSGEGLVGFTWAFLQAGAKNVIAGLWDVSDASTAELMDKLYAGIAAGQPPAEALRAAKLQLIRSSGNFRKPYYWGAFQTYIRGG